MAPFKINSTIATFGGKLLKMSHKASSTKCDMAVSLFIPSGTASKIPVIIYLAGLTCTPDNGSEKGFFNASAAHQGVAILYPDTSPRGLQIKGEDDSWDFGSGASFYLNATKEPYSDGYQMETYITKELPQAVFEQFSELDSSAVSIMGHSMGGHGALSLYLKNPSLYKTVSAFAPISNPSQCPWGTYCSLILLIS
jgi:S-formylglutathione hydrolase